MSDLCVQLLVAEERLCARLPEDLRCELRARRLLGGGASRATTDRVELCLGSSIVISAVIGPLGR